MSRIGRLPITVPAGVTVNVDENNTVTVQRVDGCRQVQAQPGQIVTGP